MTKKIILAVAIITIVIQSCKKEENSTSATLSPTEDTVYLKAKVGSLVDFKANLSRVSIDTVKSQIGKITQIVAYNANNYKMIIVFEGRDTGTYILGSTIKLNYVSVYNNNSELWRTITNGGVLKITKYDTVNHKMSGTFNADLRKTTSNFDYQFIDDGEFKDLTITGF